MVTTRTTSGSAGRYEGPLRYQCLGCGETFRSVALREDATRPDCDASRVRVTE